MNFKLVRTVPPVGAIFDGRWRIVDRSTNGRSAHAVLCDGDGRITIPGAIMLLIRSLGEPILGQSVNPGEIK